MDHLPHRRRRASLGTRRSERRRLSLLVAAGGLLAAGALTTSIVLGVDAHAARNPEDMWVATAGVTGAGHATDPHLACAPVDVWAQNMATYSGTYVVSAQAPTHGLGTVVGRWSVTGTAAQVAAVLDPSVLEAAAQPSTSYHFSVVLTTTETKAKTFWLDCNGTSGGGTPGGSGSGSGSGGTGTQSGGTGTPGGSSGGSGTSGSGSSTQGPGTGPSAGSAGSTVGVAGTSTPSAGATRPSGAPATAAAGTRVGVLGGAAPAPSTGVDLPVLPAGVLLGAGLLLSAAGVVPLGRGRRSCRVAARVEG